MSTPLADKLADALWECSGLRHGLFTPMQFKEICLTVLAPLVEPLQTELQQAQAALAAVTLERETWEKEKAHFMTSFNAAMGEKRDVVVLSGLIDSLRAQLAACQSREAKALEELERTKYELNYLRNHRNERQAEAEADRDQLQAQVGALRQVEEAAKCIRHWHDAANGGMIVSGEHVRKLWAALHDAALAQPAPAAPDSAKDGARLDWLETHHEEFAEELIRLGWNPNCDAQWDKLKFLLRRIRHAIDEAATPPKPTP